MLVSDWELLPKAGCSFGFFFVLFYMKAHVHDAKCSQKKLTNKRFSSFFFISLTWASPVHDEKGTFLTNFWMFFIIFDVHAFTGRNTQHTDLKVCLSKLLINKFLKSRLFDCNKPSLPLNINQQLNNKIWEYRKSSNVNRTNAMSPKISYRNENWTKWELAEN